MMKKTPAEKQAEFTSKLLMKCYQYETALQKIALNSYASSRGIEQMAKEALSDPIFVKEDTCSKIGG